MDDKSCGACGKQLGDGIKHAVYCFSCDVICCQQCMEPLKHGDDAWTCPRCHGTRDVDGSMLFKNA